MNVLLLFMLVSYNLNNSVNPHLYCAALPSIHSSVSALSSSPFILCVRSQRLCSITKISCPTFRTMQAFVKAHGHFIRRRSTVCHVNSEKPHRMYWILNPHTLLCGSHWGTNRVVFPFQMLMVDICKLALEFTEYLLSCHILMQARVQVRVGDMELRLQVKLSWTREWNGHNNWSKVSLFAEIGCRAAPWSSQHVVRRKHLSGQHFIRSISSGWPNVEWSQWRRSHVGRGDQPTVWFILGTKIWSEVSPHWRTWRYFNIPSLSFSLKPMCST